MEIEIYHRVLGNCLLKSADPWVVEKDGEEIPVSKNLLAFSPFCEYNKPEIKVVINSGTAQVLSNDNWMDVEIVDFDRMNLSTTQKENLFQELLKSHKYNYENQEI